MTHETPSPPAVANSGTNSKRVVGRPFAKGTSGNPLGRPKVEPRVRRYARRYDRRMCQVLASIAEDPKQPVSERRRAAMDLIAVGSGRPALVQELAGAAGTALGPLVSVNLGTQPGAPMDPMTAYSLMMRGDLEPDPALFRPAIEAQPAGPSANLQIVPAEPPEDPRIAPREPDVAVWKELAK